MSPSFVLPSGVPGTHVLRFRHLMDTDDFQESYCSGGDSFATDGGLVRIQENAGVPFPIERTHAVQPATL